MSSDGVFLLRGRSHQAVLDILGPKRTLNWYPDSEIRADLPGRPTLQVSGPDYFPSDAAELERYRVALLRQLPPAELSRLHDDPRGIFIFDPMFTEESGAEGYDEIIAACTPDGGLWFDPLRPIGEQNLAFEERETIEVTPDLIEAWTKPKKQSAKKQPAAKQAPPKRAAAKKKPVAKKKPTVAKKKQPIAKKKPKKR